MDVAASSVTANNAFASANGFDDSADVAAVNATIGATMQGIGAGEAAPELNEAIDVMYGATSAENANFTMDQDGIQGSYDINGSKRDFQIVSQSQYDKLAPEEQHAFSKSFESGTGSRYHYKITPGNNGKSGSSSDKPKPTPTPSSTNPK